MDNSPRQTLYPNLKRGGASSSLSAPAKKRTPTVNPGQFQLGNRANPNGRPKGVPNFATRDVKALARALATDPLGLNQIRQQYQNGQLPPPVLCMLWHYAFGKPKERIQMDSKLEVLTFVIATTAPLPQEPERPETGALALSAPVSPEEPEAPEADDEDTEPEDEEEDELPEEPPEEGPG